VLLSFAGISLQVSATLLLGAFFGLERRMRGYPDASPLHAAVAGAGLLAMTAFKPEALSIAMTMGVAVALSFSLVGLMRSGIQAIAEEPAIFAGAGADLFTLGGALSVGCACGTGDIRAVAGLMIVMALVSMFRPLESFRPDPLAGGEQLSILASGQIVMPHAANENTEPDPADERGTGTGDDPLGR